MGRIAVAGRPGSRRHSEDGAVATIVAITLTVLLLMSALVLDLGALRADATRSQGASDLSATAGMGEFLPLASVEDAAPYFADACERALEYTRANLPGVGALVGAPSCAQAFPAEYACVPTTPTVARYTNDLYEIEIVMPVPDGHALMKGIDHGADYDGLACERLGVRINRQRSFLLAPVAGIFGGETTRSAVARWAPGLGGDIYASLVILDRQTCGAIQATGQGNVQVNNAPDEAGEIHPGVITVDARTPASCGGQDKHVISVRGEQHASVKAEGGIFSYALNQGDPSALVYDPSRVAQGRLTAPRPGPLITRSVIDHKHNCLPAYGSERWSPNSTGGGAVAQPIDGCDAGTRAYIQELHTALQPLRASQFDPEDPDESWAVFPRDVPGASCKSATGILGPGQATTPADRDGRRWYVDCDDSGNDVFNPQELTFRDVDYVVLRNYVTLGSSDRLTIDGTAERGVIVYLQGVDNSGTGKNQNRGIVRTGQARLEFRNAFVYLENGYIDLVGGAQDGGNVVWRSAARLPEGTACPAGLPSARCVAPLTAWTNAPHEHTMGGQAELDIAGVFFTPNATPFNLGGQAPQTLEQAQFFTRRLALSGQGSLTMSPDPSYMEPVELPGVALIR
jgi:hypothetical protein